MGSAVRHSCNGRGFVCGLVTGCKSKAAGSNDKYEVKIYEKGGHGTGLFKAKVGLEDLLEQFLTKTL